jgi:crotonobetainyl-CoA:carnitine CoA-transferase CaiB-like acyl-CoA transferase
MDRPAGEEEHMPRPLAGLRILDLTRVLAGPYCTMMLGDMGADVVKVERPGAGDDTRGFGPPFVGGESTYFMSINRSKRGMTLDLKHERGLEILRQMLETADVVVENFRPGLMDRLGYGYEAVRELNPRLIYCSISGYGGTGPDAALPGYDLIIQGEGGIASLTGDPEGQPFKVGTSQADIVAGMMACQGILLALIARERTGLGQKVDIGMLDCQVALLTYQAGIYFATGESPTRLGNRHPSIVPYETFECADGYLNVACGNESMWRRFCKAAGMEDLADDLRFRSNADRVANADVLRSVLRPAMSGRTTAEWLTALRSAGVPAGRIDTVRDVCERPQVIARDMVVELEHPKAGPIRVTGVPVKLSDTPGAVESPPPVLGQHTEDVLSDWLGMSEVEVAELRRQEVV